MLVNVSERQTYVKNVNKATKEPCVLFSQLILLLLVVMLVPLGLGSMVPYVKITSSVINKVD